MAIYEECVFLMIRRNLNEAVVPLSFGNRIVGINEDIGKSIQDIRKTRSGFDRSLDALTTPGLQGRYVPRLCQHTEHRLAPCGVSSPLVSSPG